MGNTLLKDPQKPPLLGAKTQYLKKGKNVFVFFPEGRVQLGLFFAGHNNETTGGWGERPHLLGSNDTERIFTVLLL